jgi:hypothetical protein
MVLGRGSITSQPGAVTSLGAVGGARGVGAGSTRIFVDFIIRYARGDLEKIAEDIKRVQQYQQDNSRAQYQALQRQAKLENDLTQAKAARRLLDDVALAKLREFQAAQQTLNDRQALGYQKTKADQQALNQLREQFVALAAAGNNMTEQQARLIIREINLQQDLAAATQAVNNARKAGFALQEQQTALQGAQALGQRAIGGLSSLLIGAVGGVVGGAVTTALLFGPLQQGLDAVSNWMQDILDPARQARESLESVAQQVDAIASRDKIGRLEAAKKVLAGFDTLGGPTGPSGAQLGLTPALLKEAAALNDLKENADKYKDIVNQVGNIDQLRKEQIDSFTSSFLQADSGYKQAISELLRLQAMAAAEGPQFATTDPQLGAQLQAAKDNLTGIEQNARNSATAFVDMQIGADAAADAIQAAADAAASLQQSLTEAKLDSALDSFTRRTNAIAENNIEGIRTSYDAQIKIIQEEGDAQVNSITAGFDARINALQKRLRSVQVVDSSRTQGLEARIQGLGDVGPSARTQGLQDRIDRFNAAQDRAAYKEQLAQVAEQRHQILLARRLELETKAIDIDSFRGRDRLVAIDAELARIQKRNEQQDRYNQLLQIERSIQQGVQRNVGESVQAFLARRSDFYATQLQNAAKLNRETIADSLNAEKDRLNVEVQLRDLAEKRKDIILERQKKLYLQRLQDQLSASREADQKALEATRRALQSALEASRKADQARAEAKREAIRDQIDQEQKLKTAAITASRETTSQRIKDAEKQRDKEIAAQKQSAQDAIDREKKRLDTIRDMVSSANADQRKLALSQARSLDQVYAFAGGLAGSDFSVSLLRAQAQALGFSPDEVDNLIANASAVHDAWQTAFNRIQYPERPKPPGWPGYAEGGAFLLKNSMSNVFGRDIRYGEGGDEIGVILSNRVTKALRDHGGQPLVGSLTVQSSGDPYRDDHRVRRIIEDVVDRKLRQH